MSTVSDALPAAMGLYSITARDYVLYCYVSAESKSLCAPEASAGLERWAQDGTLLTFMTVTMSCIRTALIVVRPGTIAIIATANQSNHIQRRREEVSEYTHGSTLEAGDPLQLARWCQEEI